MTINKESKDSLTQLVKFKMDMFHLTQDKPKVVEKLWEVCTLHAHDTA